MAAATPALRLAARLDPPHRAAARNEAAGWRPIYWPCCSHHVTIPHSRAVESLKRRRWRPLPCYWSAGRQQQEENCRLLAATHHL